MFHRAFHGLVLGAMVVLLASCELTVRIGTTIESDGSGEFAIAMQLDRELVEGLEQAAAANPGSDLSSLETLFEDLAADRWLTTRSEPAGGLLLQARRPFIDSEDFDRALDELAGAGGGDEQPVGFGGLELGYALERSLLRTTGTFTGRVDLGFGDEVDPIVRQLADVLADTVHFEISARLPGRARVEQGDGTVEGDRVVWRPRVGTVTALEARSSQVRVSSLLLIAFPGLGLLALLGWGLMGRRPRRRESRAGEAVGEGPVVTAEDDEAREPDVVLEPQAALEPEG